MSKVQDAVDKARDDARGLHEKIAAAMAENKEKAQARLQEAGVHAQQQAATLRTLAQERRAEGHQHLEQAAESLEKVARGAKENAAATGAKMREQHQEMVTRTRDALKHVSEQIAAKRSAAKKQPA